jgi:hypothetical protein
MHLRWWTRLTAASLGVLVTLTTVGPSLADPGPPTDPRSVAILQAGATAFPAPQQIAPQVTIKARGHREVRITGPRGTEVWTASAMSDHNIPAAAMHAYRSAAARLAQEDPSCQLPWQLLAAIGKVESDHGRYGGSVLGSDGVPRPRIIGIALNGWGPVAAVHDTDGGKLDGDTTWDRAVGPMQFLPGTWAASGRDGDGDGVANPQDINDAALTAASYLCSGSGSVLPEASMKAAIFRYNPSDYYVSLVMAFETGYHTGVFVLPSPPPPADTAVVPAPHRRHHTRHHHASASSSPSAAPRHKRHHHAAATTSSSSPASSSPSSPSPSTSSPKPVSKPSPKPSPSTSPSTSPSPSAPVLAGLSGPLAPCPSGWCVGSTELDLGPATQLAAQAAFDYDGDGTVETNQAELEGLSGTSVALLVGQGTTPAVVYTIDGHGYRNADGSFPS